jgi:hypothetical protein
VDEAENRRRGKLTQRLMLAAMDRQREYTKAQQDMQDTMTAADEAWEAEAGAAWREYDGHEPS